jgi:hypothetical protein
VYVTVDSGNELATRSAADASEVASRAETTRSRLHAMRNAALEQHRAGAASGTTSSMVRPRPGPGSSLIHNVSRYNDQHLRP